MADAKPSRPQPSKKPEPPPGGPQIEYFGEGADKIKFTVDPKATRIRVFANGCVLTDY